MKLMKTLFPVVLLSTFVQSMEYEPIKKDRLFESQIHIMELEEQIVKREKEIHELVFRINNQSEEFHCPYCELNGTAQTVPKYQAVYHLFWNHFFTGKLYCPDSSCEKMYKHIESLKTHYAQKHSGDYHTLIKDSQYVIKRIINEIRELYKSKTVENLMPNTDRLNAIPLWQSDALPNNDKYILCTICDQRIIRKNKINLDLHAARHLREKITCTHCSHICLARDLYNHHIRRHRRSITVCGCNAKFQQMLQNEVKWFKDNQSTIDEFWQQQDQILRQYYNSGAQ